MQSNKVLQVCVISKALTALYCFITILVLGLGASGLAAATAWLNGAQFLLLGDFLSDRLCGIPVPEPFMSDRRSILTCLEYVHKVTEEMLRNVWQYFYD